MAKSPESFMFTVGKLDAGMAILLGERAHLIEFPSILLPPGATAGSIVNIAVHRNHAEEKKRDQEFWELQKHIYQTFGVDTPKPPQLEVRNITQTSVTLEWPTLQLATASLRSLDIFRNGQRLAAIPQPRHNTSTKLTGLELNTDYSFQLVLRTSAGTYPSNVVRVRTHTMQDTSGISVCFGTVQDKVLLENAKQALREMRARWSDSIQIDTTHFVCTTPAGEGATANSGPSVEYQRALQVSIPIVQPQWILACHAERKMVPISHFYLGATPNSPLSSTPFTRPQSMSQVSLQRSTREPGSPATGVGNRASMPPPRRSTQSEASSSVNRGSSTGLAKPNGVTPVAEADESVAEDAHEGHEADSPSERKESKSPTSAAERHARSGTMDRNFKFPPPSPTKESAPPVPPLPSSVSETQTQTQLESQGSVSGPSGDNDSGYAEGETEGKVDHEKGGEPGKGKGKDRRENLPSSPLASAVPMEVPPPDPVEKEKDRTVHVDEGDDDIGATVEVPL